MRKINSRAKGAAGERELIKELGLHLGEEMVAPLKRNLEQTRVGGHDIVGLDGWAIEVKRYRVIKEGDIARFWAQAVEQAHRVSHRPALAYREDFRSWRVRVPMSVLDLRVNPEWTSVEWTADIGIEAFAYLVREYQCSGLHNDKAPTTLAALSVPGHEPAPR